MPNVSALVPTADRRLSLGMGAGAQRLAEVHVRASIQLLIVRGCGEGTASCRALCHSLQQCSSWTHRVAWPRTLQRWMQTMACATRCSWHRWQMT